MKYQVVLTDRARADLEAAYSWWAENRSESQAAKWYDTCADGLESLASHPERCVVSHENNVFPMEIRDPHFGLGRRRTHRAVFTIRPDMVLVIAIRHLAQRDLSPDDLWPASD